MRSLVVAAALLAFGRTSHAQGPLTAVATADTPVFLRPEASRQPLRVAASGTVFRVMAEQGEWTQVEFRDPRLGLRVGFVATSALLIRRPELRPMDLSVPQGDGPASVGGSASRA